MTGSLRQKIPVFAIVFVALAMLLIPLVLSTPNLQIYVAIGLSTIVVTGLSLLMGFAGQVSLGQAAFYGIGAYTSAILSLHGVPTLLALLLAPIFSGILALIIGIPLLRLRGHALAFGTLAVQLIFLALIPQTAKWSGGSIGLSALPQLTIGSFSFTDGRDYAFLVWVVMVIALILARNISRSRPGRGLRAMAVSVSGASATGVEVERYKLKDFAFSAALAGIAGGIYAFFIGYISPDAFPVLLSIEFVIMVVVGGIGTVSGAFVGAALVTIISQVLTALGTSPSLPPQLPTVLSLGVYALVLIAILRLLPTGLIGGVLKLWNRGKRIAPSQHGSRERLLAAESSGTVSAVQADTGSASPTPEDGSVLGESVS